MNHADLKQSVALPESPRPIVIIGAGGIVRDAHLPAYAKAGLEVVGLYDLDEAKARMLARNFNVSRVYSSLRETVREAPTDAVFDIAVPASAILDILRELRPGSVVLIQKPLGEHLAEAREIRDLCRARHLTAAVNFQLRYAPYILAARELIERGALGQLHDMEVRVMVETPWHLWSFLEGIPRLEILYHSIHYLDLMRSFLGEPRGVYGKTVRYPGLDKLAGTRTGILLDYGDFLRATITTNHHHVWGPRHQESYVKWEGTHGAIKATLGSLVDYPRGVQDQLEYVTLESGSAGPWRSIPVEGSWFPDAFIGTMSSLQRFAEGSDKMLPTSVEDAYRTMALVEATYQSSESGSTQIPE
ncbi:MAG: Gfo/Idh/MocA family oxidoreductase [Chloroflexota bacterium]|nr:Gfo/Idh/MocA family oxidoreductase [Chloroflexota bacterium]